MNAVRAVVLLFLCLGQPVGGWAQGNLLLSPRRVVFEGQRRTMELNLANSGNDTARYAISLIEVRMKEDGQFQLLEDVDSAGPAASPYIRFFPRTVVLAPNEAQTVKIQVVRVAELQPGEYRSHLYFRATNDNDNRPAEQAGLRDSTSVSVSIRPVFGISIPVIIRVGADSTTASIADAVFAGGDEPAVKMMLKRKGNMSVYGDLRVAHIAPNGAETEVGIAKGVAVYTCVPQRSFALALDKTAGVDFSKGQLRLSYLNQSPKAAPLAEGVIKLGN